MPKGTPTPTQMTDGMREQVRVAIKMLELTYRYRAKGLREEYEQERNRLEDMLHCSVVPRTKP